MAVNLAIGLSSGLRAPISFGDVVQVDADIGEVRRIGIRACVIRTVDGYEVIVPNGTIISNKVTNWTFSDRYRSVEVSVRVARGVAPLRVVEVLKSVATNHPSVAKEPAGLGSCANLPWHGNTVVTRSPHAFLIAARMRTLSSITT